MNKPRFILLGLINLILFILAGNLPARAVASSADNPLLFPWPCILTLDGKILNVHPLYLNPQQSSMISLGDAASFFGCEITFQENGTLLVERLDNTQILLPDEYISTGPLEILTQGERLDAVYLPLRSLAEGFGWTLKYQHQGPVIALTTPGYQPTSAAADEAPPPLTPLPCILTLDGQIQNMRTIYLNQAGSSMVSLADAAFLFSCNIQFQADGTVMVNRLLVTQTFGPQDYVATMPVENLTSSQRLQTIYLPLRSLAERFGLTVKYIVQGPIIALRSPGYLGPDANMPAVDFEKIVPPGPPAKLPKWGIMGPELSSYWPEVTYISAYYTTLINSPPDRTHNIILATRAINGTLLASGETFSFNRTVGRRTLAADYKEALIFLGDEIVPGVGGGVCQVASTLYNTALEGGLQIVERHPHTLPVTYVAPQRDATVGWPSTDLKFKNTLGRPLRILCSVYGPYVMAALVEVEQ
ncbi:MAG: VanW family protein [Syntrophomonadaceae bacterium]